MNAMLSEQQVAAINQIIAKEFEIQPAQITPDTRFIEDLGADSLSITELSLNLEDQFNIGIPDEAMERVDTVEALYEVLGTLLAPRGE